ncbi:MAG: hypothetical protein M1268_01555 [Patescibacteria group bacterium]|nr:hypothetical protein [Patescibacteria group bacterium]
MMFIETGRRLIKHAEINRSHESPIVPPTVVYGERVLSESCPYIVDVNADNCAKLLISLGMSPKTVSEYKIVIEREYAGEKEFIDGNPIIRYGEHSKKDKSITLYIDPEWNDFASYSDYAKYIARGGIYYGGPTVFESLLKTKRLPDYLTKTPYERGTKFAERLLNKAMHREVQSFLGHETKHAADANDNTVKKFILLLREVAHRAKKDNREIALAGTLGMAVGAVTFCITSDINWGVLTTELIPIPTYFIARKVRNIVSKDSSEAKKHNKYLADFDETEARKVAIILARYFELGALLTIRIK